MDTKKETSKPKPKPKPKSPHLIRHRLTPEELTLTKKAIEAFHEPLFNHERELFYKRLCSSDYFMILYHTRNKRKRKEQNEQQRLFHNA